MLNLCGCVGGMTCSDKCTNVWKQDVWVTLLPLRVSLTCLPETQTSGDLLPPQTESLRRRLLSLSKEGHDCAKKKRSCSKSKQHTEAEASLLPLNGLTTSPLSARGTQASPDLPKIHFGLPLLHGLILRHRLKELILLCACPCHRRLKHLLLRLTASFTPFAASNDGTSWEARFNDVLVDVLLKQSLTHIHDFLLDLRHEECHCLLHNVLVDVLLEQRPPRAPP